MKSKHYVFKVSLIAFYKNVGLCPGSKGGGGYGFLCFCFCFVAKEGMEKNLLYFLKNKRLLVLCSVVNAFLFFTCRQEMEEIFLASYAVFLSLGTW